MSRISNRGLVASLAVVVGAVTLGVLSASSATAAPEPESHNPDINDFPDTAGYVADLNHEGEGCTPGSAAAGDTVTATFRGYHIGTPAQAIVDGVVVFDGSVDSNPFSFTFMVPSTTTGNQTVQFSGTGSDDVPLTRTCTIEVVVAGTALARTGADVAGLVAVGSALILLGGGAVYWVRRRSSALAA